MILYGFELFISLHKPQFLLESNTKILILHSLIHILYGIKRYLLLSQLVPHLFPSTSRIILLNEHSSIQLL